MVYIPCFYTCIYIYIHINLHGFGSKKEGGLRSRFLSSGSPNCWYLFLLIVYHTCSIWGWDWSQWDQFWVLPFWARVIPPMAWQAPLVIRVVRAVEKAVREFQKQGDLPKLWLTFGWYKTTNICSCILLNPILYSLTTNIWLIKIGAKNRSSSLNYLSISMNQNLYFGIPTHTYTWYAIVCFHHLYHWP